MVTLSLDRRVSQSEVTTFFVCSLYICNGEVWHATALPEGKKAVLAVALRAKGSMKGGEILEGGWIAGGRGDHLSESDSIRCRGEGFKWAILPSSSPILVPPDDGIWILDETSIGRWIWNFLRWYHSLWIGVNIFYFYKDWKTIN